MHPRGSRGVVSDVVLESSSRLRRRVAAGGKKKGRRTFRRKEAGPDSSTDGATDLQHEDTLSEYEASQDELEDEEDEGDGDEEGNEDGKDEDGGEDEEEEMEDAEEESEKPESELDVYEEGQSDTQRLSSKRLRRSGRVIIEEPPSKRGRWSKGFTSRWAASNKGPL